MSTSFVKVGFTIYGRGMYFYVVQSGIVVHNMCIIQSVFHPLVHKHEYMCVCVFRYMMIL